MTPNEYIQENYESLKRDLYNITKGEDNSFFEDFVQDVMITFLTHPKAQQVIDDDVAKFFMIRIGLNQWRSSTSRFHYKYRVPFVELTDDLVLTNKDYDLEVDVLIDVLMQSLDQMYKDDKTRYQSLVIILYHSLGDNYSEVQRQFEIPRTTVRNIYKKGLSTLQTIVNDNIQKLNNGTFQLSNDITGIVNDWCNSLGTDEQQALSVASELFKTKYFKPA